MNKFENSCRKQIRQKLNKINNDGLKRASAEAIKSGIKFSDLWTNFIKDINIQNFDVGILMERIIKATEEQTRINQIKDAEKAAFANELLRSVTSRSEQISRGISQREDFKRMMEGHASLGAHSGGSLHRRKGTKRRSTLKKL